MNITTIISNVMNSEIDTMLQVKENIDQSYERAVEKILNCTGKVILLGVGKSGHIGKKLAATFASTGTPSFFVHATEAVHGDLGMIEKEDVVIAISNSGETKEVLNTLPSLRRIGASILSITGNKNSTLAKSSEIAIEVRVEREADQHNLAPTNSSTATLVVGDALALTVSQLKGFKKEDFGLYHPGGSLGKQLFVTGFIKN
ncbi:SIS domain-containing protein [Neobacillus sp. YIM B02564]|uniref:SIS domain-containing protein n=1 Tax=Neobacillus paridis TaxID=2803862 RepID=A0ABS1TU35_9BACI|nr:SIS domain-containing protein [Neobacillus paridis]MBL4954817.1 SIS domain-containing protein [Neobacillus paridis]